LVEGQGRKPDIAREQEPANSIEDELKCDPNNLEQKIFDPDP